MHRFPPSDRYRAERLLGVGATGRVYSVVDRDSGRTLALKLVDSAREADFESLQAEFRVLSHLQHPMLARVVDFGRIGPDRLPFFTQERVDGVDPRAWVGGDPLRAASVGVQLCWALAHVHLHGILHLDIKPENLRVQDGLVHLLDFGLARRADDIGMAGGTPAYVAPEVATGRTFDVRADLYGVGATLFALVAGRPPFVGGTVGDVIEQLLFRPARPLEELVPETPAALGDTVGRLLRKDPGARPRSALAVVDELSAVPGVREILPALPVGHPGLIGRDEEAARLSRASGLIRIRGAEGTGKRFLLERRLQEAQADGKRVGRGSGRGLDALEQAIRAAGGSPRLPDSPGAGADDARQQRLRALLATTNDDMVLGLVHADDLPDLETDALIVATTTRSGPDGITLEPFEPADTRRFLEGARPGWRATDAEVARAQKRCGGLPALLALYVVSPDADLDLASRASRLPGPVRAALQALSLLPHAAPPAVVAGVAGLETDQLVGALVALTAAGLCAAGRDNTYAPRPEELRETLAKTPVVERGVAEAMARRACDVAPSIPALRLAGDPEALLGALREATSRTLDLETHRLLLEEVFAHTEALEDALALEQTLDELGRAPEQGAVLAGLPDNSAEVRVRRGRLALKAGRLDEAVSEARAARAVAREPGAHARALRLEGLAAQHRGDHAAASEHFAAARSALPATGGHPITRAHTVHDLGTSALYLGRFAEAVPCFRESLRLKLEHGDLSGARIARQNLGICHEALGAPRLALRAWEEALALAREARNAPGEAWNHMALGGLLRRMGRHEAALQHLTRAESIARPLGQRMLLCGVEAERALVETRPDTLREAEARLRAEGDSYDADRVALHRIALELQAGAIAEAPLPGAAHFPERVAALSAVSAVRGAPAGDAAGVSVPDGDDPCLAIARAEQLRAQQRPREAEIVLREALDRAWDASDRAWLQAALGGPSADEGPIDAHVAAELARVTRGLAEAGGSDAVLTRVLDTARALTRAERGFLLLEDGGVVRVAASAPAEAGSVEDVPRGIALEVLRTGEPVRLADAQSSDHLQVDRSIAALGLQSVLCVPMRGRASRLLGCLYLDHRGRGGIFGASDVRFVELLADHAAIAFETARLVESTRAQADEVRRLNGLLTQREAATLRELHDTRLLLQATRSELHTRFPYAGVVGRGRALKRSLATLDRVIPTPLTVLLEGESGTGKELLARAVHENGPRAGGPFVAVNCGAIPESLIESAVFGHVRGAFTGAAEARQGYFALANCGTLFLDEVGELPLAAQAKLLRVLETGTFWPVGGSREEKSDVRIVAATHRDLGAMVRDGSFREDLYYRLAQVRVPVPSLRDRPEDIPLLVEHFLAGRPITSDALRALTAHDWPGNVRELKNELERASAMADSDTLEVGDLSAHIVEGGTPGRAGRGLPKFSGDLKSYLESIERRVVGEVLEETGGNKTRAAEILGVSRFGLRKKLERLGIQTG